MIRRPILVLLVLLGAAAPVAAQATLTLTEAIARARTQNPDAGTAAALEREAAERVVQARAGYWPKVDASESWQRGNQPVFVFGSLLAQRRFTAADFALDALNRPDAVANFRSALTVEQALFDGPTRARVAAAGLDRDLATNRRAMVNQDLAAGVTAAYGQVLVAGAANRAAQAAAEAAAADRDLAAHRRDAGLVTDADVLQLDVHVARTAEQRIRAASHEQIARAELNQLMGEPLTASFDLDRTPVVAPLAGADLAGLEREAIAGRPDVAAAVLRQSLADTAHTAARAAFLPQVAVQGGWEWNGGAWSGRASSWVVGATARVNLFQGFADKARVAEAREQMARRALEREKTETAARLDVQIAVARLDAARASESVGRAALDQARESRRIIRDRYEAGLTDVASLIRSAELLAQAETQQTAARVAVLTETAALERSLGR